MEPLPNASELARLARASSGVRVELVRTLRQRLQQNEYQVDLLKLAERLEAEFRAEGRRVSE